MSDFGKKTSAKEHALGFQKRLGRLEKRASESSKGNIGLRGRTLRLNGWEDENPDDARLPIESMIGFMDDPKKMEERLDLTMGPRALGSQHLVAKPDEAIPFVEPGTTSKVQSEHFSTKKSIGWSQ